MRISDRLNFKNSKILPCILQTNQSESGLACIAMIAGYYDIDCDFQSLRREFSVSSRGMTASSITYTATQLNFHPRKIDVDFKHFNELTLPCIIQAKSGQYFVLKSFTKKQVVVHDPNEGVRKLEVNEFLSEYNGIAIELIPSVEFVESTRASDKIIDRKKSNTNISLTANQLTSDKRRFSWRKLLGSTKGLNTSLIQVCALAFAMEVTALLLPLVNQLVFDQVIVNSDWDLLALLAIGLIILELTRLGLNFMRAWTVMILSAKLNVQWVSNVFCHLLKLPIDWFEQRHTGDITSRFGSVSAIQGMITTRSIEVVLDGIMSVCALVVIYIYHPLLASVIVSLVIVYFGLRLIWYKKERVANEASVIYGAQQYTLFLETLRSMKTVRLFNANEDRMSRWQNRLVASRNAKLKAERLNINMEACNWILFGIERVVVIWLGASAVINNEWSIGMFIAFMAYKELFAKRAVGVVNKVIEFKLVGIQTERLSDIVLAAPEEDHQPSINSASLPASLSLTNISFRYSKDDPMVVDNCSFKIEPGESVAIVGASGCGKSTLLKLMLGLVTPKLGRVECGGVDINSIGTRAYRDLIGVVLQDDNLFSGTIAENINFFSSNSDQSWLEECAAIASIHDEITAMPMGYQTLIGDMGGALSGGQKQRLFLARALYKKPKILFLDEATSHLDVANETNVNTTVRSLGLTTVVIAHRPDTIRMADRILLMENGTVKEVDHEIIDALTKKAIETGGIVI